MIHEYALEPELVATWTDRRAGRYFLEKFGLGRPRIVSRYPKGWKKLVWEAFGDGSDLDRKRLEEVIARLGEAMVKRRDGLWDRDNAWLENAEREHDRVPFHAILARANPRGLVHVLFADELDETTMLWAMPHGRIVARTAAELATVVASMLRIAKEVVLVDPYFGPRNPRYSEPLTEFLRAIIEKRPCELPHRIEVQSAADGDSRDTPEVFREECQRRLPRCVPRGLRVQMVRLREREGCEELHNRYILTELGGVEFGAGLDRRDAGSADDINLLDRGQYLLRWRQYASDTPEFDRPEPAISIEGAR